MSCYVCGLPAAIQGHHIVPQARGGTKGPVVDLCASCHQCIHSAAKAMQRGKDGDAKLVHLVEVARDRARALVQMILLAHLSGDKNPRPLISAVLDDPAYLDALKRFQIDKGFTSQAAAINGMLRAIAVRYGLVDDATERVESRGRLRDLRGK